jgi:hypothetical protein
MSTTTPAAPPHQAPLPSLAGPITRARARDLNFVMLLKNEGPENRRPAQLRPIVDDLGLAAPRGYAPSIYPGAAPPLFSSFVLR